MPGAPRGPGLAVLAANQGSQGAHRQCIPYLVTVAGFFVILWLAGVLEHLPPHLMYPLPPGTVRVSVTRGYLVAVLAPRLVLSITVWQLLAAASMGVALGSAAQRVTGHGGSLPWFSSAIGATSVVTGAAALAACCSPMTQVIGTLGGPVTPGVWFGITGGLLGTHLRHAMGVPRKAPRDPTRRSEYLSLPRQNARREMDGNL